MLKDKQGENINKNKLNYKLSKNIQIIEDLERIVIKGDITIVWHWNDNSETWNKETELR